MADETDHEHGAGTASFVDSSAINPVLLGMSREKADALGDQQIRVAIAQEEVLRLQAEDLKKEDKLRHWSLRVRHTIDLLKVSFSLFVALVGLVLATGVGMAIWSAVQVNGLIIESFSVPNDFSARGLTGQVIASQVLDKLAALQAETDSSRAADSYANNWGNDIKVQIPEAGISVGELNRYLRAWLGHETHITGELFRTTSGIAITARSGSDAGQTLLATEAELDSLIGKTAEAIYRRTQPYRYGRYLDESGRLDEAADVFQDLALHGSPREQGWGLTGLAGVKFAQSGAIQAARDLVKRAVALDSKNALSLALLGFYESSLGNPEAALNAYKSEIALLDRSNGELSEAGAAAHKKDAMAAIADMAGDYKAELDLRARYGQQDSYAPENWLVVALARCFEHEPTRALSVQRTPFQGLLARIDAQFAPVELASVRVVVAAERKDWQTYIYLAQFIEQKGAQLAPYKAFAISRGVLPGHAIALARLGHLIEAHRLIEKTPLDCYACIVGRALIDGLENNVGGASFWFARAVQGAPSSPYAYVRWGEMLMHRGDSDGAIAKFALAHQKGPHFADPLEMWGEALMQQNRSHLALAKFEEANRYAPRWGRLHLEWGTALGYLGRKAEARAQYEAAATMDLSAADKTALATQLRTAG